MRVGKGKKVDRKVFKSEPECGTGRLYVLDLDQLKKDDAVLHIASAICTGHCCSIQGAEFCLESDQNRCARHIVNYIIDRWGMIPVGLIGLNHAVAKTLVESLGSDNICITDLDFKKVGRTESGLTIWDGQIWNEELIRQSALVLATVRTLENGTFDHIWDLIRRYEKPILFYGSSDTSMGKRYSCSCEGDALQDGRTIS